MIVTAKFDDGFRRLRDRARAHVVEALATPAVQAVRAVVADARGRWPVDSGESAAAFRESDSRSSTVSSVQVTNPVWYALRVHEGRAWEQYVRQPMAAAANRLAVDAGRRVIAALRRR